MCRDSPSESPADFRSRAQSEYAPACCDSSTAVHTHTCVRGTRLAKVAFVGIPEGLRVTKSRFFQRFRDLITQMTVGFWHFFSFFFVLRTPQKNVTIAPGASHSWQNVKSSTNNFLLLNTLVISTQWSRHKKKEMVWRNQHKKNAKINWNCFYFSLTVVDLFDGVASFSWRPYHHRTHHFCLCLHFAACSVCADPLSVCDVL